MSVECKWCIGITHSHFSMLKQNLNPGTSRFYLQKVPISGLLLTHFRFEVNSEIGFPGTLDIYLTNASGFIILIIQLLQPSSQT